MTHEAHRERMLAELERRITRYARHRRWRRRLRRLSSGLVVLTVLGLVVLWLWGSPP